MAKAKTKETQLAIIGAGPGGYAAAFHAAELGIETTLINMDPQPGGVCLNRGCIPSKALLHIAKLVGEARDAKQWGVHFNEPKIDLDALRGWKNDMVDKLAQGVTALCKRRKVNLIRARAEFADSSTLQLHSEKPAGKGTPTLLRFQNAIVSTGSLPAMPGLFRIGDERVLDSTDALNLDDIPKRLLVIGGGYIGLEMGTVYAALGSKVTVVEMLDNLLPGADPDLVRPLQARLEKSFEAIQLKTRVEKLAAHKTGILVHLKRGSSSEKKKFDKVLVAIGRQPNLDRVGLENTRIELDESGFIKTDRQQRTAEPNVFAIGDVAGEPMLAHKASREGKVAAEAIAGLKAEFDNIAIPAVIFTDPEIAWCGLTETQAKAEGREVRVGRFPWSASGRAQTLGRPEGLTKILFEPETERVLGVGIVGVGAGELIAEGVLAVEMAAVAHDLAGSIHPHPTMSETMMEAAEVYLGHATHIYRPRKK